MIDPELVAKIRLLFFAEHWKIGTIATQLNLHRDTVRAALQTDRFNRPQQDRSRRKTDPYVDFIRQTLAQYPRLRSTRIFQMIRARGYEGGSSQLRRLVARLRPVVQEPFLQLRTLPGEQAQADWADFGEVRIGQARRRLSCFVITLSYSRALALNFFFDQTLESLLHAHVQAFAQFQGCPRIILYDNMRSVVLARHEIKCASIPVCWSWPRTITSPLIPVARRVATRKDAWSESFATSANPSLPLAPSPP